MDYIIFGIGSSATLVLAGWLLRDWGPRLRDRQPPEDEILSASVLVLRMAWARFCATCGTAILICGILVMLATLGAAFLAPSDRSAAIAVVASFGVAIVLMLLWTGLFLRQFGAFGILRPREKRAPAEPAPTPADVPATTAAVTSVTDEPQPAPSFAETAATRGGLGRFAAFFRKEPAKVDEPSPDARVEAVDAAPVISPIPEAVSTVTSVPDRSPTEAVMAELAGQSDIGDDKALAPDDPLVTSVRDVQVDASTEETGVADDPGPAPGESLSDDDDTPAGTEGDATVTELSDQEVALAQLRRRRVSRLGLPSEPD